MGRKKKYNRDELINKAMELFRDQGYGGCSAEHLVEKLGVNRYSIYAEFGSKQGLYEEAIKRYNSDIVGSSFGSLEKDGAGLDEIIALIRFFGTQGLEIGAGRGCLLCNAAVEFGPEDPTGEKYIKQYFKRLSGAFYLALEKSQKNGELNKSIDLKKEASFLTSIVLGLFVMLRANTSAEYIKNSVSSTIEHLNLLRE